MADSTETLATPMIPNANPVTDMTPTRVPPTGMVKRGILASRTAKFVAIVVVLILAAGAGAGGVLIYENSKDDDSNDSNQTEATCTYNGKEYKEGEGFESTDGCNSCSCQNGEVVCTLMACENTTGEETQDTLDINDSKLVYSKISSDKSSIYYLSNINANPLFIADGQGLDLSSNGNLIIFAERSSTSLTDQDTIYVYDIDKGTVIHKYTIEGALVSGAGWNSDSTYFLVDGGTDVVRGYGVYSYPSGENVGHFQGSNAIWIDAKNIVYSKYSDVPTIRPWGSGQGGGVAIYNIESQTVTDLLLPTDLIDYGVSYVFENKIYFTKTEVSDVSQWQGGMAHPLYSMDFDGSNVAPVGSNESIGDLITQSLPADLNGFYVFKFKQSQTHPDWFALIVCPENFGNFTQCKMGILDLGKQNGYKGIGEGADSIDW